MKKRIFFVLGLLMAVVVQGQTYWNGTSNKVFSGSGTQTDPYLIGTAEQLAGLAERTNVDKEDFAGQYIKLTADIYLTNFNDQDTANWQEWIPIARTNKQQQSGGGSTTDSSFFCGHFDGDGHTIYNLYYNGGAGWGDDWDPDDPLFDPAAFIGALDLNAWNNALFTNVKGGTIENLNMANGHMCGIQGTSFLANNTTDGAVVRNCHVQGYFRGTGDMYPAGLVAYNYGLIENSSANVTTQGSGGASLVYTNEQGGVIRNCTATGTITPLGTSAAGLVYRNEGLIEQSQSSVAIIGLTDSKGFGCRGGGFCWLNDIHGTIRECVATGNITATAASRGQYYAASGFCVVNIGRIESSYCTGDLIDISATTGFEPAMASFVGQNGDAGDATYRGPGTILNCFSTSKYIYNSANFGAGACGFMKGSGYQTYSWLYPEAFISRNAFCWYNDDELSATDQIDIRPYGEARSSAYLHSQAFVDTLNMCASFLGTSQWELRNGIPQPTGVYTKNTGVFFAGGEGTKENPYLISNKAQLENFRWLLNHGCYDFCGEYIKQTADIELNAPMSEWGIQMPEEWEPIGGFVHSHPHFKRTGDVETAFRGVYDGDFHEIKNMYIDNIRTCQGFFGSIGGTGFNGTTNMVAIRNLGVTDAYVVASNTSGILAGAVGATVNFPQVLFLQCHTSGQITSVNGYGSPVGAIAGAESECLWLNCTSSAKVSGHASDIGDIWGDKVYLHNDTIVNYLFTGRLNDGSSAGINYAYGYNRNVFEDGAAANITTDGHNPEGVRTTAYLQSKEYVNVLNYAVSCWNDSHNEELQMDYWEWQEGNYPKLTKNPSYTPVVVTFNSNGGSAVVSKTVVPGSRVEMPVRPLKDGLLFVAWYKDAALTQIFDFYKDSVLNDMTLYARWRNDEREDIDITPFNNKFTNTYHIQTAAQLRGFAALQNGLYDWSSGSPVQTAAPRDFTGKTIVLDNDILLCDTTDWQYWGSVAYGLPWKPIGSMVGATGESRYTIPFNGTFDGQGHVIYGLYAEQGGIRGTEMGGLFHWTGDDAVIQNVGIEASVIDAQRHNTVGQSDDHSWYYSSNQDRDYMGMLAGHASGAKIKQCYAVGRIYTSTIGWEGGFIYEASDSVINCYARIDMYKDNPLQHDALPQAGMFVHNNGCSNKMQNCYTAGRTRVNGLSGTTSYYNKELVTTITSTGIGKNTYEMHTMNAYAGWDFENVWARNDDYNDGYPVLRVFHPGIQNTPDPVLVTGITLQETSVEILTGDSTQLHASVIPANAANQKIHWTSNNVNYATVDENGFVRVTASTNQTAIITATTEDGGFAKKCTLNIKAPTVVVYGTIHNKRPIGNTAWQSVAMTASTVLALDKDWEYLVGAYVSPAAAQTPFTWQSSDENVLKVIPYAEDSTLNNYHAAYAVLQCVSEGTATVTATGTKYGKSGSRNYKVVAPTTYTIRFLNWDGSVLQSSQVAQGSMPSYTGVTPTKPEDDNYTYTFSGWSPTVVAATANADYTAQFTARGKQTACENISATWLQPGSGSLGEMTTDDATIWKYDAQYGSKATKQGGYTAHLMTPAKDLSDMETVTLTFQHAHRYAGTPSNELTLWVTANYLGSYAASQWQQLTISPYGSNTNWTFVDATVDVPVSMVGVNTVFAFQYTSTSSNYATWEIKNLTLTADCGNTTPVDPTYYTIRFLNYDGTVLQSSQVAQGTMPSYTGATPTKPEDDDYTYAFNGWSPAVVAATADADYTAQFTATAKPQGGSECDPYVCDFTKKSGSHTAYTDSWTYDNDWTVFGGANNGGQWDYVKMGGRNTNLANANPVYVVNKTAFECEIASVKVTFPAGSFSKSGMSCNNWGVKVYSDLACNNLLYTVNGGTISKNAETLTVTPAAGQPWSAGYAIQVYWNLANTSTTNGIVLVSKIEYIPTQSTLPTDIQNVSDSANNQARKVLINGQILILRGEKAYTIQGQEVKKF